MKLVGQENIEKEVEKILHKIEEKELIKELLYYYHWAVSDVNFLQKQLNKAREREQKNLEHGLRTMFL